MKMLLASDSYKGSLSTMQVAEQIKVGALRVFPDAQFLSVPVADGGEGTVDTMINCMGGHYEYAEVMGPNGDKINAKFGILEDGKAVIEMAAASGLPLVPLKDRNIMGATTYGTGEMIKAALDHGCTQIYVGIGGSATNDGGVGMAQALGASFTDYRGREVGFGGQALKDIEHIDLSKLDARIKTSDIVIMSDVTNPLCGENGAAAVYGPQKGAGKEQIRQLDQYLDHLADIVVKDLNYDGRRMPGAGAAGGLGMGMVAFLDAKMKSGIEFILDSSGFAEKLLWADLVITGEGSVDGQSVNGKVIDGIARRAKEQNVPVIVVSGSIGYGASAIYQQGIGGIEAAVCRPMSLEEALEQAEDLVADAVERILRAVAVGKQMG